MPSLKSPIHQTYRGISDALSHGAYIAAATATATAAQPHGAVGLGGAAACWDAVKKAA